MSAETDFQLYVIDSRKTMLQAAGLWSDTYNAMQVVILAGLVMDDEVVEIYSQLEQVQTREPDPFGDFDDNGELLPEGAPRNISPKSAVVSIDYVKLFAIMPAEERAAMRERIRLRCQRS
jgi:hypothetical protein